MIFAGIQAFALYVLNIVLSLFPTADAEIVSQITSGLAPFKSAVATANWFFPVGTFFTILGIVFSVEFGIFSYKLVLFLARNISLGFFKG